MGMRSSRIRVLAFIFVVAALVFYLRLPGPQSRPSRTEAEIKAANGSTATQGAPALRPPDRSRVHEELKLRLALLRGEPAAADRIGHGDDEPAWAKTIRAAYGKLPPACAADLIFSGATYIRRNFQSPIAPVKPEAIGTTADEFAELHKRAATDAVLHLTDLLRAKPATGARCDLGDPIKIAERIIEILRASDMDPEDAGLTADGIAQRLRIALKAR